MIKYIIKNIALKGFFKIPLSTIEQEVTKESIEGKYKPAVIQGIISCLFIFPSILFLDSDVIVQVLIPVTMVAGTAWYSVSLASMKKKFENFGLELTTNLFSAFVISLMMLFTVALLSLTRPFWIDFITDLSSRSIYWGMCSALLGAIVVGNLLFQIFLGSLKYDINDAMLTGQNEAAEKFFKRGLSVLYSTASTLRNSNSVQVANYLIGVSFYEVFQQIKNITKSDNNSNIDLANKLIFKPSMDESEANAIAVDLIKTFLSICIITDKENKHYQAIIDEESCLVSNKDEVQEMIDIRLSIIFEEIAALMEEFGESLFINNEKLTVDKK